MTETEQTIEALFTATYPRLVSVAYGVTRDLSEAQDVAQEAFEKLVGRSQVDRPEAWLRTVTVNIAIGKLRRRLRLDDLLRRAFSQPEHENPLGVDRLSMVVGGRVDLRYDGRASRPWRVRRCRWLARPGRTWSGADSW